MVPVKAKKARSPPPNFAALAAVLRFSSVFSTFVNVKNIAVVLRGFITAIIDDIANMANSIIANTGTVHNQNPIEVI